MNYSRCSKTHIVSKVAFHDKLEAVPCPGARQESALFISAAAHRRQSRRLPQPQAPVQGPVPAAAAAVAALPLQPWAGASNNFQSDTVHQHRAGLPRTFWRTQGDRAAMQGGGECETACS